MTRILLKKRIAGVDYTFEIFSGKVEENIQKDPIFWAEFIDRTLWPSTLSQVPVEQTKPKTNSMDFLNITREFTITGFIERDSYQANGNAPRAREILTNMILSGGTVTFYYGITDDVTGSGYTPNSDSRYYSNTTPFVGHITKMMISELPKGAAENEVGYTGSAIKAAPEKYEVTLTIRTCSEFGE
jgi:hypothetical protein